LLLDGAGAFRSAVVTTGGWRRHAVAFLAGLLSIAAIAPFHLWPILALTLPVLVWLLDGADHRHALAPALEQPATTVGPVGFWAAFAPGWWFGFGYHTAGLYWIGEAFLVEAEHFAWALPFAVTLLPAGLALFWGFATLAARRFAWPAGLARAWTLALALCGAEWLRGHALTGFPWNALGYALTEPLALAQSAGVIGLWGLTLVALVVLTPPLLLVTEGLPESRRGAGSALLLVVVPLPTMLLYGHIRLADGAESTPRTAAPRVRIVQPSVPQREKWRPENQGAVFRRHLDLSRQAPDGHVDDLVGVALVVWPEAAMPFVPLAHPEALAAIATLLPPGTHLASGALRVEPAGPAGVPPRRVYNSLLVHGEAGAPVAIYDKTHLVPFGEYLPLQSLLEAVGLRQLTRLRGGFATGPEPRSMLIVPGLPAIAPLICYEAIFPGTVVQSDPRPGLLLNVTNDGWFGNSTGPRQHLQQARLRAIEEGLPLLRAANNGISAIIDGKGRVLARLDLEQIGTIDATLPPALAPPPYARIGDLVLVPLLALVACAVFALRGDGRRDSRVDKARGMG
jgi:apolipoprotein N-acyltransferase